MMKRIIILILILNVSYVSSYFICNAQEKTITLSDSVVLYLKESIVDPKLDFQNPNMMINLSGICFIDEKPIFGTDCVIPHSKLDFAYVVINAKRIDLDVSHMYNPIVNNRDINSFRIKKRGNIFLINAIFSDGAGTYAVQWIVSESYSERTIITNDELVVSRLFPLQK